MSPLLRFIVAGGATAALFFALCWAFLALGLAPFAGTVLAYAISFGVGYAVQRNWTFRANNPHATAMPRYLLLQAGCALASGAIAQVARERFALTPLAATAVTTAAAGAVSYVVSSSWVFRRGPQAK